MTVEMISLIVTVQVVTIYIHFQFQGGRVVQERELKLPSGWCLRNTKGGRVV